ncbi:MAG: biotin/lipoyl-containing protein, partial [Caulobacteraceae bacterium]
MAALTDIIAPLEQEGTKSVVRKWLASVGDQLKINDPIVELETDKVSVEVAAEAEGVLAVILMTEGEQAEPGAVLGRISTDGQGPVRDQLRESELDSAIPNGAPSSPLPLDGGEAGRGGERAVPSEAGAGGSAPSSVQPLPAVGSPPSPALPPSRGKGVSISSFDPELRLSPSVRRRLIETGADPEAMTGTGKGGRLTRSDVDAAVSSPAVAKPPKVGGMQTIPHDSMRLRIAEHMASSVRDAPHV